jgi:glutaminyl-peptide cyclotransferase
MRSSLAVGLLWAVTVAVAMAVAPAPPKFDGGRAYDYLRQVVAFGPRPAGSPALESTRQYIKKELRAAGIDVVEQPFDAETPIGRIHMVNLVARIPGASPDRIVFAGHYDTKLFREFRFVGANDAGSSTAFLMEWGRLLKARKNAFTTELLFLDGEEATVEWQGTDHTYGSRHYVEAAQKDKTIGSLRALILVDMIGDRDLHIKREANSSTWLTDAIWAAGKRLNHGDVFLDATTDVEDDHIPFLNAGVPAVDIIDGPEDYPPWHTAGDTLDKVSARSLQAVGDVLYEALPAIEKRAAARPGRAGF